MRSLLTSLLLRLESDVGSVRADAAAGIRLLALLALAVVGGAALIARGITFQLSQPLQRIETVLDKVAQGELHRRSGVSSSNEVGRVGLAVDKMLSRVEFQESGQTSEQNAPTPEPATPVSSEVVAAEDPS
jgi:HAMP domain-containing protein